MLFEGAPFLWLSLTSTIILGAPKNHAHANTYIYIYIEGGSAWGLSFSDSWGLSFSDSWGLSFSDSWGLSFSIKNTKKYQTYTIKTGDLLDLLGCVFVLLADDMQAQIHFRSDEDSNASRPGS